MDDSIVGADTDSSLHRVLMLLGYPLGLTKESVEVQEYVVFFVALLLESLFVFAKANAYGASMPGPRRGRGLSTASLEPMLSDFHSAWNEDVKHAFRELAAYVFNRDAKRVRLGIPETDGNAQAAIEVLVTNGYAEFVERHCADDLEEQFRLRIRVSRRNTPVYVDVFDISADTWSACMAATSTNSAVNSNPPPASGLH